MKNFMVRHDLTIMTITQRLSEELISFQKYVVKLRKQYECLLGQIRNVEQSPVFVDIQNPQQLTLPVNKEYKLEQQEPRNSAAP
jgi:hypothetical protein